MSHRRAGAGGRDRPDARMLKARGGRAGYNAQVVTNENGS
jgi:hypothetical protein